MFKTLMLKKRNKIASKKVIWINLSEFFKTFLAGCVLLLLNSNTLSNKAKVCLYIENTLWSLCTWFFKTNIFKKNELVYAGNMLILWFIFEIICSNNLKKTSSFLLHIKIAYCVCVTQDRGKKHHLSLFGSKFRRFSSNKSWRIQMKKT